MTARWVLVDRKILTLAKKMKVFSEWSLYSFKWNINAFAWCVRQFEIYWTIGIVNGRCYCQKINETQNHPSWVDAFQPYTEVGRNSVLKKNLIVCDTFGGITKKRQHSQILSIVLKFCWPIACGAWVFVRLYLSLSSLLPLGYQLCW